MITALVQFSLPAPLSVEQARAIFRGTAPFTLMMLAVLLLLIVFPAISLVLLK